MRRCKQDRGPGSKLLGTTAVNHNVVDRECGLGLDGTHQVSNLSVTANARPAPGGQSTPRPVLEGALVMLTPRAKWVNWATHRGWQCQEQGLDVLKVVLSGGNGPIGFEEHDRDSDSEDPRRGSHCVGIGCRAERRTRFGLHGMAVGRVFRERDCRKRRCLSGCRGRPNGARWVLERYRTACCGSG